MQKGSTVSELSLKGRWVSVAKAWLVSNVPCTKQKYFENVTSLMPVHISYRGRQKLSQLTLSKTALTRLLTGDKGADPFFVMEGDLIIKNSSKRKHKNIKYDYSWLSSYQNGECLKLVDHAPCKKQREALRCFLVRTGFKKVSRGVYQKVDDVG